MTLTFCSLCGLPLLNVRRIHSCYPGSFANEWGDERIYYDVEMPCGEKNPEEDDVERFVDEDIPLKDA